MELTLNVYLMSIAFIRKTDIGEIIRRTKASEG